jgi:pimeloyl-ACP methyl ester carboxylesterase
VKIYRPTLVGLSAGGFGAVRIFIQSPNRFARLIVLAAYPPEETWARFDKSMPVYFLVGARESYVQSGFFGRSMQSIRQRVAKLEVRAIPDADHFFLLAQKQETLKILHSWLETPTSPGTKIQP